MKSKKTKQNKKTHTLNKNSTFYVPCVILILIEIMKTHNITYSSDSLLHIYEKESLKQGCNDR
jgi:hypothetical protein